MNTKKLLPATLAVALLVPAAAAGKPPIGKVFGCYQYTGGPTGISLVDAVELNSTSSYRVAPSYKGHRLYGRTAKGTYGLHGNKLAFRTGPFKHLFGTYTKKYKDSAGTVHAAQIHMYNNKHEYFGVSCYLIG